MLNKGEKRINWEYYEKEFFFTLWTVIEVRASPTMENQFLYPFLPKKVWISWLNKKIDVNHFQIKNYNN